MNTRSVTHLLYLHGFRSSPQSTKARTMAQYMALRHPDVQWWCPQLPASPRAAMDLIMSGISDWPRSRMAVVGSSLGGFYATYVAEMTQCRAVLLNPAVYPARDLTRYIGEHDAWHNPQERIHFRPEYIGELQALEISGALSRPQRLFVIMAKGDEVLDWREMSARYADCQTRLLPGGDHALSDFTQAHLPDVIRFLQPA